MKIFKKLTPVFTLVFTLLTVLAGVPAHAEVAEILVDDFSQHTEEKGTFNYYPTDTGQTSEIFTDLGRWTQAFSLVKHADASGEESMMLRISAADSDDAILPVKTMTYSPGQIVRFSYDIYFDSLPADGKNYTNIGASDPNFNFRIDPGDSSVLKTGYDGKTYTLSEDVWYKILAVVDAQGTQTIYLTNPSTGEIYFTSEKTTYTEGSNLNLYALWISWAAPSATILIDNAEVLVYNTSVHAPSIVSSSVEAGETDVQRNRTLTFAFDQELADGSSVTITKKDGTAVSGVETRKLSYNTISVTYDGLLDRNTEYTLSFAAVSNGTLACADTITFTTEDLHIWNDISVLSAVSNAGKTDVTFTIGDVYGYPTFSGSVMAAVYQDGKMLDVDMQPLTNAQSGEITVGFALGTVPADAEIGVILVDLENGPKPLAGGRLAE